MLIDEVEVVLRAGHGGAGKVSFGRRFHSGPDGGNGGKGGDVYIKVTSDLRALNQFSHNKTIAAQDGLPGGKNRTSGKDGEDTEISLPVGTSLIDEETNEETELTDLNQAFTICRGGLGGRGNFEFKSGRNTTPTYAQPGLPGEEKHIRLILKFIAEYGLIGLPNSGKSSILNELTQAHAEVGAYPFTTVEANLGVWHQKIIADIPGLIEGAAEGKGLGIKFLKHIEKVKKLLHCINADSSDVVYDFKTINTEMKKYEPGLIKKDRIILLTKIDLVSAKDKQKQINKLDKLGYDIYPVSIYDWESIKRLESVL